MTRRRRGGIKSRERKLASSHFPMCSPLTGSLIDIHGVTHIREEGGRSQRWLGGEEGESILRSLNELTVWEGKR